MALGLIQSFMAQPAGTAMTYSEFKQAIRSGQVAEVTVSEQSITGTFKQARGGSTRFSTTRLDEERFVLRACITNYRTQAADVLTLVQALNDARKHLAMHLRSK